MPGPTRVAGRVVGGVSDMVRYGSMSVLWCHVEPELSVHEATVVDRRPGGIALRSVFHPGGGGQVADRGRLVWTSGAAEVNGIEIDPALPDGVWWHLVGGVSDEAGLPAPGETVEVLVDTEHRLRVASLHTVSHALNALVFEEFAGALVTGAQINGDGTGRMDFDLPDVDNDRLRALEAPVNAIIAQQIEVRAVYVDAAEAERVDGLVRSMSVAPPPTPDGRLRLIEIVGVDRQACGGTHLTNTGQSGPIRITKIENKGRRNRRVRFAFAEPS